MTLNETWAANLSDLLKRRQMPVAELAKRCGVTRGCVYAWTSGGGVDLERLERVAKELNVTPAYLLRARQ